MKVELTIDNIAMGGDGVGRLEDGRVCFVDRGFPGETVKADVTEERKSFLRARVTEVVEKKFDQPIPCPVADACGGCRFWGASYEDELRWKFDAAVEAMNRIAGEVDWPEPVRVPAVRTVDYRSRAELRIGTSGEIGYLARGTDKMVPTSECPILRKELEVALVEIGQIGARYGAESAFVEWDEVREHVVVEYRTESKINADVKLRSAEQRLCDSANIGSVVIRPQGKRFIVRGDGTVHRHLRIDGSNSLRSEERNGQFAQAFREMNEVLVDEVREIVEASKAHRIVDLFSGAGNLSLGLWMKGAEVVLMDSAGPAIEAARRTVNNQEKVKAGPSRKPRTVEVNLLRPTSRVAELLNWAEVIILDPPRGGVAKPLRRMIAKSSAQHVVYVSCDPPSMARDVQSLTAGGWVVESLKLIDLFPRTPHCETVVYLSRSDSSQSETAKV